MGHSSKIVSFRSLMRWWVAGLLALLLACGSLPVWAQRAPRAPDRAESLSLPIRAGEKLSPMKPRRAGVSPASASISIGPVLQPRRAAEAESVSVPGTPHKIGFGREVPQLGNASGTSAFLQWQVTPQAGRIAAISITSPQAAGIRLGILVRQMPAEATLRFYAQGAEAAYEVSGGEVMESIRRNLAAGEGGDAAWTYWSPQIDGEEVTLEIELPPGVDPVQMEIAVPRVSHFFRSPLAAQGENTIKSIGDAASCEIDATCYSAWSAEGNATAKMSFVGADGSSHVCSGTLLNDMASSTTPYFLSANHCISKQTEASTLQTYWFYRSAFCNSGTLNPGTRTLTGGATLLYASSVTDTSFMRLNRPPPAGATYAAWDSAAPALGTAVTAIHHAKGDLQKISFGAVQSFHECTVADPVSGTFTCSTPTPTPASGEYLNVVFTSGITEAGSSGSGLFKTSGNARYLIGQLYGGSASCSNPGGSNEYGRFDVAYTAALSQWLSAGSTVLLSVSKQGNGSGTVTSTPAGINCGSSCSAPFAPGTGVTLTAVPAAGSSFAGWSGSCSGASCSLVMNADSSVTATFSAVTIPLGVALDNTGFVWTTGGNAPFTGQTATSYSGGSAAQTGKIGDNQSTYLATSVTGPGTLSFYWKVSSERYYDIFSVYLDGVEQYSWSGNTSWYKTELAIPAGTHTVKWEYRKDSLYASGQDAGWVDNVVFTPACTYTLPAATASFSAQQNIGAAIIHTAAGCSWTASSHVPWITITFGSSGSGNGTVVYSVAANSGIARTGTMTIGGKTFTVSQSEVSCAYALSSTSQSFTSGSGTGTVGVAAASGCTWTASSNADWITITSGSGGSGNGTVSYAISANGGAGARSGTLTIAGQTFTVSQGSLQTYFDAVQKVYIGYYQRPADPAGLIYWAKRLEANGGALNEVIEAFAHSSESVALYGIITGDNIADVVNDVYVGLFARPAEAAGRDYYVSRFRDGSFTAATIMLNILDGATGGDDLLSVNNKLTAANLFTRTIDPGLDGIDFQATYAGDADTARGRGFLAAVTWDPSTVPTQLSTTAYIRAYISDPGDILAPAVP